MPRMGVMESAVALRSTDADEVADVFQSFMRSLGHPVEVHYEFDPSTSQPGSDDVLVAPSRDGWVYLRPHYVVPPDALAVEMTRRLGTLASAIMIYEDVLWTHHLVDRGTELDRHVNLPGYFGPGEYDDSWIGDPDVVAGSVGVDRAEIAPYFQQVSVRRARSRLLPPPKAHQDDTHALVDGWVVTELWRRMGIHWPGATDTLVRLPLGQEGTEVLSAWARS